MECMSCAKDIWSLTLPINIKIRLFITAVESIAGADWLARPFGRMPGGPAA